MDLLRRFWDRPSDPRASERAAKGLARLLPLSSPPDAHQALADALARFNAAREPAGLRHRRILAQLSEAADAVIATLTEAFLAQSRAFRRAVHPGWRDAQEILSQLTHAYSALVYEICEGGADRELGSALPGIAASALRYAGVQAKWHYFRETPVPEELWSRINAVYEVAEKRNFAASEIVSESGTTSCSAEFLRILALDLLNPHALPATQVEPLFHWLAGRPAAELWPDFHADVHSHCIDLHQPVGPQMLCNSRVGGDGVRYFSTVDLALAARRDSAAGSAILEQAAVVWQRGASQRMLARAARPQGVEVVRGVHAVRRALRGRDVTQETEHWIVRNLSVGGLGAMAPQLVTAGEVVATHIADRWEVAVVRWVRDEESGVNVGVECWSDAPRAARVMIANPGERTLTDAHRLGCIYLPSVGRNGIASSLLLPRGLARHGMELDLLDRDFVYRIRIAGKLSHHENWARARFDILSRRRAS